MKSTQKLPLWTLEEGIAEVRRLQAKSRDYGYHICIGGGVVNAGLSYKDLDIYFLPLDREGEETDYDGLLAWLESEWGVSLPVSDYPIREEACYRAKLKFIPGAKRRIDAFIVKG